ncbi:MAG TPA: hypothetical protein C5S50_11365 [Methanosarcinaceae archaeon]|nr:hypothetical protein [Methanosarcinaceae archaeon]
MKKIIDLCAVLLFIVLIASISGCVVGTDDEALENGVAWIGTPPADSVAIEKKIIQQAIPYTGTKYENITVSALQNNGKLRLHVSGVLANTMRIDLYDFTYNYDKKELTRVSYLLEAIPESVRGEAIGIAMQDEQVRNVLSAGMGAYGNPSVKRILPETAEKFYEPKTLLSVTWKHISLSALVDVDAGQVVDVWSGN